MAIAPKNFVLDALYYFSSCTELGFQAEALLTIGEEAAGTLLGLEQDNVGGFLAKGDLCR